MKNRKNFLKRKIENGIPSWVDPDYGYDPQNPRKPNMRELMEAISGKDVEDLYAELMRIGRKLVVRHLKCFMAL